MAMVNLSLTRVRADIIDILLLQYDSLQLQMLQT